MDGAVGEPLGTSLCSHFAGQETQRDQLSCGIEGCGCTGMGGGVGGGFPSQLCEQEHSLGKAWKPQFLSLSRKWGRRHLAHP